MQCCSLDCHRSIAIWGSTHCVLSTCSDQQELVIILCAVFLGKTLSNYWIKPCAVRLYSVHSHLYLLLRWVLHPRHLPRERCVARLLLVICAQTLGKIFLRYTCTHTAAVKRQRLLLLLVPAALLRYLGGLQEACAALLSGSDAALAGVAVANAH